MSESGQTTISPQAIIVICLAGAGALVLCGYAVGRHYYDNQDNREINLEGQVHDGVTQSQYMRMVRLRNQEDMQRTYAPNHHQGGGGYSQKYPMSSVNSV